MKNISRKTFRKLCLASFIVLPFVILIAWGLLFTESDDPKNIRYVCWKAKICSMDPDKIVHTLVHDPDRLGVVRGMTVAQLAKKIGYVTMEKDASPYLQWAYENFFKGKNVVFLRNTELMVILEDGRAVDIFYVKG